MQVAVGRPRRVLTDVGAENLGDGRGVPRRVHRDPFQGVDAAQPDDELVAAELINRPGEPLRYLTLL
ncbi:MAG TPA: hypothetical protein VK942_08240, partial [Actinomycetes bacterium]|nr:hypothetical protein [Actinomycetes bacterium]